MSSPCPTTAAPVWICESPDKPLTEPEREAMTTFIRTMVAKHQKPGPPPSPSLARTRANQMPLATERRDVDRAAAFARACAEFGEGAVVGLDAHQQDTPFSVGKRWRGRWLRRGLGTSWDDAFARVVDLPDGPIPAYERYRA